MSKFRALAVSTLLAVSLTAGTVASTAGVEAKGKVKNPAPVSQRGGSSWCC